MLLTHLIRFWFLYFLPAGQSGILLKTINAVVSGLTPYEKVMTRFKGNIYFILTRQ